MKNRQAAEKQPQVARRVVIVNRPAPSQQSMNPFLGYPYNPYAQAVPAQTAPEVKSNKIYKKSKEYIGSAFMGGLAAFALWGGIKVVVGGESVTDYAHDLVNYVESYLPINDTSDSLALDINGSDETNNSNSDNSEENL